MTPDALPETRWLARKRAAERVLSLSLPVLRGVAGVLAVLLIGLVFLNFSPASLLIILGAIVGVWMVAGAILTARYFQKLSPKELAMRADRVLGLPDDLLALSEFPDSAGEWESAAREQARRSLEKSHRSWRLVVSWRHIVHVLVALTLTLAIAWKAWDLRQSELRIATLAAQARDDRAKEAEEVIQDWEEFAKITEDPELQKLFTEATALREAVQNDDPMAAMLEMNKIEAKMTALADALAAGSMAPQAAQIAEALEAFAGLGALSASLRNQNYAAAEDEARTWNEEQSKDGSSNLRRGQAVAEILAKEAATARTRGNHSLSETLSELSQTASRNAAKNSVPNSEIPMHSLQDLLAKEAACKASGRCLATGRRQLENLRKSLRGEPNEGAPSLCQGNRPGGSNPGGSQAGVGTDGQPLGAQTALADATQAEALTGTAGEGESEITTTSSSSGSSATASAATASQLAEYIGLSEKAVADESLPLAHRQVIRSYFERIRPTSESKNP